MRPQRLCTWLCHRGRRTLLGIICLTLGPRLLPPRAVSARIAFSPHVRILGLILGLKQSGNAGCATLNTCCLNMGISSVGGSLAVNLLRDDLFRACSGSDHATAALLATFPSDRTPIVAATTCAVPFLLDPADALGRHPPWRMKLQCLALAAEFLLACGCAWCLRRAPGCLCPRPWWQAFAFLLGRPSARGCSACGSVSAPPLLPAPAPVLHMSAPVRRGAVADARLGLA